MTIWDLLVWVAQGVIVFFAANFLFDVVHYFLHRWTLSPIPVLRTFAAWHQVHHAFLDKGMRVHPEWAKRNFWAHLLPEYLTSVGGAALFLLVFPPQPVMIVWLIQTCVFIYTIVVEGRDVNHMEMDRLNGQFGRFFWVSPSYHALHHIFPNRFYSSYSHLFDIVFGTGAQFERRNFLVTGASGAFGSALVERLKGMGAHVETAKSGRDFGPADYGRMDDKLRRADVLVLSHGAKSEDCYNANCTTFVDLIERFREIGKDRLVPPEVWALGSEAEFHGDMGMASLRDYAGSKRAFAWRARDYYRADDLIYRHIVPAAFTSQMGKGLISAEAAVSIALFFIKRGFRYVPVTYTTLAFWNYFRFAFFQKPPAGAGRPGAVESPAKSGSA